MKPAQQVMIGGAVFAAAIAVWVWLAPYFWTHVWWFFRGQLFWMLPLLVGGIVLAVLAFLALEGTDRSGSPAPAIGVALLAIVGLGGFVAWCVWHDYATERAYAATIQVSDDPVPQTSLRAPYQVAEAQARPNLGGEAGDITNATYVPDGDHYTSLVLRRGTFEGYSVVLDQKLPLTGRGQAKTCKFSPDADMRLDGWFGQNLGRYINADLGRGLNWTVSDAYGYCDGATPMVVVPLTEQEGWLLVTEKPAGAAVYNGRTGELSLRTDLRGIPGPSYSLNLAAKQREGAVAMSGFWDWWYNRSGFELSEGDDNFNSSDAAEFVLSAGGRDSFVTPLTGRGSATAISAVSVASARGGTAYNSLVVHRLRPSWVSPSAIADRIKADFQDVPNWQNIRIMEVLPRDNDSWVATLGTGQNVLYRAEGKGTIPSGDQRAVCLQTAGGEEIRCGAQALQGGNGVGTQYGQQGPAAGAGAPAVAPDADLGGLSAAELAELQARVAGEVSRRLTESGGGGSR